jgi:hypothetical protein
MKMSKVFSLEKIKADIDGNWQDVENCIGKWAEAIHSSKKKLVAARKKFNQPAPLRAYTSVTDAGNTIFSLRFKGQEVGKLKVRSLDGKNYDIDLMIDKKHNTANLEYFFEDDQLDNTGSFPWQDSAYSKKFRAEFKKVYKAQGLALPNGSKNNKKLASEHHVESLILEEMQKDSSKNKFGGTCHQIQPVMIGGCPFQCPVPFSFSGNKKGGDTSDNKEVKATRGNIDILARNNLRQLSVWELKRPSLGLETQAHVQAFTYAYTLLKMLRSEEHGNEWWEIFGFKKDTIPKSLTIEAVPVFGCLSERKKASTLASLEEYLRQNLKSLRSEHKDGVDIIQFRLAYYHLDNQQDPREVTISERYSFISEGQQIKAVADGESW